MKQFKNLFSLVIIILFTNLLPAQDWANLERFNKENMELANPKSGEQRIVFMGNSITIGWLNSRPEFFQGKPIVNRGISGQTTPQMLIRFRQDVIDLKPTVVVILAGINDIAQNTGPITLEAIAGNIFSMAELAGANGIKVVLCSVLPAFDFSWRPGLEPANKVVRLNSMIEAYTKKHQLEYVDYFSSMVDASNGLKKDLGDDGVHPNVKGYMIMEPLLEKALFNSSIK